MKDFDNRDKSYDKKIADLKQGLHKLDQEKNRYLKKFEA